MERLLSFFSRAGVRAEAEYPLAKHSSFRIGGMARIALFPKNREEMLLTLCSLLDHDVRFVVIGNASNVVFPDGVFEGAVVFTGAWRDCAVIGSRIQASAGVTLLTVSIEARRAGLAGAEFAYGIPGTLGGAVFMNAGAFGGAISDVCESSEYFDTASGKTLVLHGAEQAFGNRTSIYTKHPNYTILGATLCLRPDDREVISAKMEEYLARRRNTQPLDLPSAGSVFKRPEGYFAGKLIEDCGLKGMRVGGAEVSTKHAGFIVNRGGASAEDVKRLVELIREKVLSCYGVALECEIRFL